MCLHVANTQHMFQLASGYLLAIQSLSVSILLLLFFFAYFLPRFYGGLPPLSRPFLACLKLLQPLCRVEDAAGEPHAAHPGSFLYRWRAQGSQK